MKEIVIPQISMERRPFIHSQEKMEQQQSQSVERNPKESYKEAQMEGEFPIRAHPILKPPQGLSL